MDDIPNREDIPAEYRWNLDRLYTSVAEWRSDVEDASRALSTASEFVEDGLADGGHLLEAVERYEDVATTVEQVMIYAARRRDVAAENQPHERRVERARTLAAEVDAVEDSLAGALSKWDADDLARAIDATDELEEYRSYLRQIRVEAAETGSTEEVLPELEPVVSAPEKIHRTLLADLSVPPVEDSDGRTVRVGPNYLSLLRSSDRTLRRNVYRSYYDALADVENVASATLDASVTADVRIARLRGYESAQEMVLDGDEVPASVLEVATGTVTDHLDVHAAHLERKRWRVDVEKLRAWDCYVSISDCEPEVPYDDATKHVVEAVDPLGEDYRCRLADGLADRWVDVYPHVGKRPTAYNSSGYDTHPYVSLNYRRDVSSLFQLAHELGHAFHARYTTETQPYVYSNPSPLLAEVTSTVNEVLVYHHLRDDGALGRAVAAHFLEALRVRLFRNVMLTRCEQRLHEVVADGGTLTAGRAGDIYEETRASVYEPVEFREHTRSGWVRLREFYSPYSVYHYAVGMVAAIAIVERLRRGDISPAAYVEMLRNGSRQPPVEQLAALGVDVRSREPYDATLSLYRDALDRFPVD